MLTDEQLAEQLKKGKARALDELYTRYARPLYVFCANSSRTKNPEDVVHDVFIRILEHVETFDSRKASFRTWMYKIARHRCIDLARHDEKISLVSLDQNTDGPKPSESRRALQERLADTRENVEQLLARRAEIQAVRDCIGALSRKDEREALTLYYLVGKVYREIGEALGKSTGTAKNYVTAARAKVKRCLEGKGF